MDDSTQQGPSFKHPQAEQAVLSALLNATPVGFSIAANGLNAADFSTPHYGLLFSVLKDRLVADLPIDPITVAAEATNLAHRQRSKVKVPASMVLALVDVDWRRADAYAETVKRFALLRRAQHFAETYLGKLEEMPDPDELYAEMQETLRLLMPAPDEQRFTPGDTTPPLYDALLRRRRAQPGDTLSLSWPWSSWNRFARPLRAGEVALLAAPTGVGKSTYLEMVAEHWALYRHTVFVHLENDLEITLDRRMARHANTPIEALESGAVAPDTIRGGAESIDRFAPRLHYVHAAGWTTERILSELAQLQADGRCECFVFDYLNKVRPTRTQADLFGSDQWARMADDMEQIKTFCETHGAAAMVAAQMTKSGNEADPEDISLADVRGSQEVVDKVQLAILVGRKLLKAEQKDSTGRVLAEAGERSPKTLVRFAKQNRGRLGMLEQIYVGKFYQVRDKEVRA